MLNSTLREKFNFCFSRVFPNSNKNLFWKEDWAIGYGSINFRKFPDLS